MPCTPCAGVGRGVFDGGKGVPGARKFVSQNWPDQIFPIVDFVRRRGRPGRGRVGAFAHIRQGTGGDAGASTTCTPAKTDERRASASEHVRVLRVCDGSAPSPASLPHNACGPLQLRGRGALGACFPDPQPQAPGPPKTPEDV